MVLLREFPHLNTFVEVDIKNTFGADMIVGSNVDINPDFAYRLSGALAKVFQRRNISFVVGMGTTAESKALAQRLAGGLIKCGVKVFFVGITTCGGIVYAIKQYRATAGVLVTSCEHNEMFGGFKIYNGNGFKISDEQMSAIQFSFNHDNYEYIQDANISVIDDLNEKYAQYLLTHINKKITFAVDVTDSSGEYVCQHLKKHLDLQIYNSQTSGLERIEYSDTDEYYVKGKWNLKLDNDCEKISIITPEGKVLKGDTIVAIFCLYYNLPLATNLLTNNTYFDMFEQNGIKYELTGLGERRLVDTMLKKGYEICGEKSGRIIFLDTKSSDAFITAFRLFNILQDEYVQKIINMPQVPSKTVKIAFDSNRFYSSKFDNLLEECEQKFNSCGKLIVRANHLENYLIIYLETKNEQLVADTLETLNDYFS